MIYDCIMYIYSVVTYKSQYSSLVLFSYFNYIFNIWEWFNVNGYHLVMLSGVNTLRYMHILKEMRNFKWVFLEAVFKWVWPKRFIWVWADGRLCIFGDHPITPPNKKCNFPAATFWKNKKNSLLLNPSLKKLTDWSKNNWLVTSFCFDSFRYS